MLTLGSAWEGFQEEGLSGAGRLMGEERQILPQHDQYPRATGGEPEVGAGAGACACV